MKRSSGFLSFLVHPSGDLGGAIVLLSIGIIINLISGIIQFAFKDSVVSLILIVCAIIVLIIATYLVWRARSKRPKNQVVTTSMQPAKRRALVIVVGPGRADRAPGDQSAGLAIKHHLAQASDQHAGRSISSLKYCWIVTSPDGVEYAKKLKQEFRDITFFDSDTVDPFKVQDTYDRVRQILTQRIGEVNNLRLGPDNVICDPTGGTKPMSIGMALACGVEFPMQYAIGNQTDIKSDFVEIRFKPEP